MSKHKNYSKMYTPGEGIAEVDESSVNVEAVVEDVEPTVEPVVEQQPEYITGVVVGCSKLNVRENPDINANVVCVLNASTEVQVSTEEFGEWVHVCNVTGLEGYCMKRFIETV